MNHWQFENILITVNTIITSGEGYVAGNHEDYVFGAECIRHYQDDEKPQYFSILYKGIELVHKVDGSIQIDYHDEAPLTFDLVKWAESLIKEMMNARD
jgi:hypothetical protein